MKFYEVILMVSMFILVVSATLVAYRFIKGPTLADRIAALDLLSAHLIGIIALYAVFSEELLLMDAALILSLIGFLGTMSFAYFLIHKKE